MVGVCFMLQNMPSTRNSEVISLWLSSEYMSCFNCCFKVFKTRICRTIIQQLFALLMYFDTIEFQVMAHVTVTVEEVLCCQSRGRMLHDGNYEVLSVSPSSTQQLNRVTLHSTLSLPILLNF